MDPGCYDANEDGEDGREDASTGQEQDDGDQDHDQAAPLPLDKQGRPHEQGQGKKDGKDPGGL
jgi:hypothetical protein